MKKRIWIPLVIAFIAAAAFFTFAPGIAERDMNRIDGKPLGEVSDGAKALHATLDIVDLHADTLLWRRSMVHGPVLGGPRGHVDLDRLEQGNVAIQVFSSVTKTPTGQNYDSNSADGDNITGLVIGQLQPVRTWSSLLERSKYHWAKLVQAETDSAGRLTILEDNFDLDAHLRQRDARGAELIGAVLSIEGLHNLEGKIENLDVLYEHDFRMAGLTHFFDNKLAGSMHGIEKGGLTPFGRSVVQRMEELGMIVDIAHLSKAGVADVLAMARRPVVSSHGGVQATCEVNRNLDDDEIRGLAATGGIIGVGYWEGAICDTSPAAVVAAMKHIRDLVGIEHVALGSDYDGAVTVRFDTAGLVHITQALLDAGFTTGEIRAVMGGNAIRVLREGMKPLAELPEPATEL
ncbi:dipeptidase [Parerythrobacter jejuensis]|uniref:Peptidase M19 n=1 Tax=Parerythrobacter jejuensis TaxID=795812 RepID=A0A845AN28_9SPHN|nr:dipeptidase [Parerythrobacter jejuensis]MXP30837.1 peptidase M19 [Parerythrobacter jejuensis]MXP33597.1 peptidase M19 [Parerythrobacter jejuensis]